MLYDICGLHYLTRRPTQAHFRVGAYCRRTVLHSFNSFTTARMQNRRVIREAGGCEALVSVMRAVPLEDIMEHAMGALHNLMLTGGGVGLKPVCLCVLHFCTEHREQFRN